MPRLLALHGKHLVLGRATGEPGPSTHIDLASPAGTFGARELQYVNVDPKLETVWKSLQLTCLPGLQEPLIPSGLPTANLRHPSQSL